MKREGRAQFKNENALGDQYKVERTDSLWEDGPSQKIRSDL